MAVSKEVLDAISKAEAERLSRGKSKEEQEKAEKDITEKMVSLLLFPRRPLCRLSCA